MPTSKPVDTAERPVCPWTRLASCGIQPTIHERLGRGLTLRFIWFCVALAQILLTRASHNHRNLEHTTNPFEARKQPSVLRSWSYREVSWLLGNRTRRSTKTRGGKSTESSAAEIGALAELLKRPQRDLRRAPPLGSHCSSGVQNGGLCINR